jgi:hypothetical protein
MSQDINEPVPGQSPIDSTKAGTNKGAYGAVFLSQVRDQTGASGGGASGVYNSQEFYNPTARGVQLLVVISPTGAATGTATFQVQVIDPVTSTWVNLGGAPVINGTGALNGTPITVYPGLTGIADSISATGSASTINQHLGPRWRLQATLANAALTFTVGGNYLR